MTEIKVGDKVIRFVHPKKPILVVEAIKQVKEIGGRTVKEYGLKTSTGYTYLVDEKHFKLNYRKQR